MPAKVQVMSDFPPSNRRKDPPLGSSGDLDHPARMLHWQTDRKRIDYMGGDSFPQAGSAGPPHADGREPRPVPASTR